MDCKRAHEHMSDAVDGELPWWRRWVLRVHLLLCAPCRRSDERLREAVDTLASLRDVPPAMDDSESPDPAADVSRRARSTVPPAMDDPESPETADATNPPT
jgi:hypothetical protein